MDTVFGYRMIAAALSPTERWAAARSSDPFPLGGWTVWVPMLAAIVVATVLIMAWRRHTIRREIFKVFFQAAERLRLSASERAVLVRIAEAAEVKRFDETYTVEMAFEKSAARLMETEAMLAMTEEVRRRVSDIIDSLRTRLGFGTSAGGFDLSRGDRVTLVHRGTPPEIEATVVETDNRDITLQFDGAVSLRAGEACALRHVRGQLQWEFNVSITEPLEGLAVARLIGEPYTTDLRRFARVVTRKTAHVARFPFLNEGPAGSLPEFVAGTLTEIAGPGLRIEAPIQSEVGDCVLVILEVADDRIFQGRGLVRRFSPGDGGVADIAVEMIGMTEDQIADLVKETNAAARRQGAEGAEQDVVSTETA